MFLPLSEIESGDIIQKNVPLGHQDTS